MAPRIVSPLLQVIADAVSSPLIIVGNTGAGGTSVQAGGAFVEAANDLAVQLLRPDSNGHLERDDSKGLRSSLLRMPLAELLEVVGGQLEAGCIADCTTCLPSGATVAVKCDCRRCDLPEHPNLLFVNLMPGISEPDAFEDEDEQQVEQEEAVRVGLGLGLGLLTLTLTLILTLTLTLTLPASARRSGSTRSPPG